MVRAYERAAKPVTARARGSKAGRRTMGKIEVRNQEFEDVGKAEHQPLEVSGKTAKDDFSRQRYEWYRDGILRGWSAHIAPMPGGVSAPTREEVRAHKEWADAYLVFPSWELAEFSGTTLP